MSLQATIIAGVETAFASLGDIPEPITVSRAAGGAYDPATGTKGADPVPTSFSTDGIPDQYDAADLGAGVEISDVRVYVRVAAATFEPRTGHKATFRGVEWGVESVKNHARALYELQLRRAS